MKAFISWTGTDRDVKNLLVDKLQAAGIVCWDSDEECTSDYSSECIAAINRCGLFIVIVSDAAMQKGYVLNEVIAARNRENEGKLNILVYKITDKPYSDAFSFQLNHISTVTENLIQRRETYGEHSGLDVVVRRAKKLLTARENGNPEKPFDVKTPKVDGLAVVKAGFFVENSRDGVLDAMEKAFLDSNILVLREFFGFGKRSTIRKFVEQRRAKIESAVFVNGDGSDLRSFLLSGLQFSNINPSCFDGLDGDALIMAKIQFLEKLDERNLLVIADLDCGQLPDQNLCQLLLGLKCRIVLLTQDSATGYADWFPVIRVGRMENAHLSELFFHHYTRADEDEKEALRVPLVKFFDRVGGHTKTIELTASVLNRDLGVLPENVAGYLSMDDGDSQQLQDRVLEQISSLFDMEQLSGEQGTALLVAACLAVPYLPERNYRQILRSSGVTDYGIVMELDRRRWLDLDRVNQTVSVEPLVAQIIFKRFSEDHAVLKACLDYVENAYARIGLMASTYEPYYRILGKFEYFLRIVGMNLPAQITGLLRDSFVENEANKNEELANLVRQFDEEIPTEDFLNLDEEEIPEHLHFAYIALKAFRTSVLPICRMRISKFAHWQKNVFSNVAQPCGQVISMEELAGITREELEQMLQSVREQLDSGDDWDDEALDAAIMLETVDIIESVLNGRTERTYHSMVRLLDHLLSYPEVLESPDTSEMIGVCIAVMCNVYIAAGANNAAIMLCEQVIELFDGESVPPRVYASYIEAMRNNHLYTEKLFSSYRTLLECYEKEGSKFLDDHQDLLLEKSTRWLRYAQDLTVDGKLDLAKNAFERGSKAKCPQLLDTAVSVLYGIVQLHTAQGEFDEALAYLKRYFTPELAEKTGESNTEIRRKADELINLLRYEPLELKADNDHTEYLGYYHSFSRKNNALLERKYFAVADRALNYDFSQLTNEQITEHARCLRSQASGTDVLRLAPEAFALASEAGYRVLGYRHHYVQYMAAAVMADGKIAEVLNGEGKTYTVVLTAFLHSLYGGRVFVVDASHYLTQRNHSWMRGVYALLGVNCVLEDTRRPLHCMGTGVCYIPLNRFMFAYLKGEMEAENRESLQMDCVIIDEADTVLVDGAMEPYSIAETERNPDILNWCRLAWELLPKLQSRKGCFTIRDRMVVLSPESIPLLEKHFSMEWGDPGNASKTGQIEELVCTAISAVNCLQEGKDYYIHNGIPVREEKKTGTFTRIYRTGCEYFLCRKHGLDSSEAAWNLSTKTVEKNLISPRDLFRKSRCVCGTTATAVSFKKEFREIYGLEYVSVPPHKPCIRKEHPSVIYMDSQGKMERIVSLVEEHHLLGQPVLLCTQSVEESELYDRLLCNRGIKHKLLNAKNAEEAAHVIAFSGVSGSVLVANALAGRGADIKLGGNPEMMSRRDLVEMGVDITGLEELLYALPTPQIRETDLYKRYHSILEKNRVLCEQDRQRVWDSGGLCVIVTSFFSEARNEQQAVGRAGRQGEPGESYVFCSLDDEWLEKLIGPVQRERIRLQMRNWELDVLDTKLVNHLLQNAQRIIHNKTFASIRECNNLSACLDEARSDLLGLRIDVLEDPQICDSLVKQWAADKHVLKQLQALQQGAEKCQSEVVLLLWKNYDELKRARGLKLSKVLQGILQELLDEFFLTPPKPSVFLANAVNHYWVEFIKTAKNAIYQREMDDAYLRKYLESEKQRLKQTMLETLIKFYLSAKLREGKSSIG